MCKKNGAISEFMLFPYISEFHKKCAGSTHATFSVALRPGMMQTLLDAARVYFVAI
jgi:hypothetical protein